MDRDNLLVCVCFKIVMQMYIENEQNENASDTDFKAWVCAVQPIQEPNVQV